MTLTRTQIRWIMAMVAENRDNSDACRQNPNNKFRSLHNLEYENMRDLHDALQAILDANAKRITIR